MTIQPESFQAIEFKLHSVAPVSGLRAVYKGDNGECFWDRIYAIAIATKFDRLMDRLSMKVLSETISDGELVSLVLADDQLGVAESASNFIGICEDTQEAFNDLAEQHQEPRF